MNALLSFLLDDTLILLIGMSSVCGILEIFFPARPIPRRHYFFSFLFGLSHSVLCLLIAPIFSFFTTSLIRKFGVGLIDLNFLEIGDWGGSIIILIVSTLIADFFFYWFHRIRHSSQTLWQIHLVHHSDEHMNVLTYARNHFTELFFTPIFVTVPIAVLFQLPPVSIAILSVIPRAWEYVTHANLKVGFGPFWWLLTSPDYHRIHHSIEKRHFDKNFATWFPLWDIVFGTAWRPRFKERPATGVKGISVKTVLDLYLMPFRGWARGLSLSRSRLEN